MIWHDIEDVEEEEEDEEEDVGVHDESSNPLGLK